MMIQLFSADGIKIFQKNLSQIILRGKGDGKFAEVVNKEVSLLPPLDNLRVIKNDRVLFAKQSFDQWSLVSLEEQKSSEILKLISNMNIEQEILASDYSSGQVYFEVFGDNKNEYLNKLTHFDLRKKKFPISTIAQTLIARIECTIYHLENRYLITCNKSVEDYFKDCLSDILSL